MFTRKTIASTPPQVPIYWVSRDTHTKSCKDYAILLEDDTFTIKSWTRARLDAQIVDTAIAHTLAAKNVSYFSWGTKSIKIDGGRCDIPILLRKKPVSAMFEEYKARSSCTETLSRASFYHLADAVSHGELQARKSVGYVTGLLVYATFDQLRDTVLKLFPEDFVTIETQLEVIVAWLKHAHASAASDLACPSHDIAFGLSDSTVSNETQITAATTESTNAQQSRRVCCSPCQCLHRFFSSLRSRIVQVDADASALQVVNDVSEQVHLFIGHRLRVVNQQHALEKRVENLGERARTTAFDSVLVIVDFKMKAEPSEI